MYGWHLFPELLWLCEVSHTSNIHTSGTKWLMKLWFGSWIRFKHPLRAFALNSISIVFVFKTLDLRTNPWTVDEWMATNGVHKEPLPMEICTGLRKQVGGKTLGLFMTPYLWLVGKHVLSVHFNKFTSLILSSQCRIAYSEVRKFLWLLTVLSLFRRCDLTSLHYRHT